MTYSRARAIGSLVVAAALLLPGQYAGASPSADAASAAQARATSTTVSSSQGRASGEADPRPVRTLLVHNIAGRRENGTRVDPVATETVAHVRKRTPYAAMLQEACIGQVRAIDRRLARYRAVFFAAGRCRGGQEFGTAILIRNGPVARRHVALPTDGLGARSIGCVSRRSPRVAFCTTHLTAPRSAASTRRKQAGIVARVGRDYVRRGFATFVGGDLNDTPTADTLDPLYRPAYGGGARGVFTESNGCCGRSGRPTLGSAKFDYGFASHRWRVRSSFTSPSPTSDHDRLWTFVRRTR